MRKVFLLLSIISLVSTMKAQKQYVYLKNGSVIKGKPVYSSDPRTVGIKSSGSIYMFKPSEIDTITLSKPVKSAPQAMEFRYFFRASLGILPGNPYNEQVAPAVFAATFNRQVYKNISAGIGSGLEFYNDATFIPLYANLEYRFRNTRFSPVVFMKTGYLFAANETVTTGGDYPVMPRYNDYVMPPPGNGPQELEPHGGFMVNPGVGMNIMVSNGFGFFLGFGYRYHKLSFEGSNEYSLSYNYNRLSIDIGIIFK